MTVTVILPCAGEGTRLGLPFPKELAPIAPGRAVIDSCLDLIGGASIDAKIVLMDDGNRELTRRYIERRLPDIPLAMVKQHRDTREMPEAVLKLIPWVEGAGILMLPDVVYDAPPDTLSKLRLLTLIKGFAVAASEKPAEALRSGGALRIQSGTVVAYEEKPEHPEPYNAAWGLLGFHGAAGLAGMQVMQQVARKTGLAREPFIGAPVISMPGWRDCGTWGSYIKEINGDANE